MIKFKQHIPNYVTGLEPEEGEFKDTEELLASPKIKRWSKDKEFSHYAISKYTKSTTLLMAVFEKEHWVIGYIKGETNLVEWKRKGEKP